MIESSAGVGDDATTAPAGDVADATAAAGDAQAALALFRQVRDGRQAALGEGSPYVFFASQRAADIIVAHGDASGAEDLDDAQDALSLAQAMLRDKLGDDSPHVASIATSLAAAKTAGSGSE